MDGNRDAQETFPSKDGSNPLSNPDSWIPSANPRRRAVVPIAVLRLAVHQQPRPVEAAGEGAAGGAGSRAGGAAGIRIRTRLHAEAAGGDPRGRDSAGRARLAAVRSRVVVLDPAGAAEEGERDDGGGGDVALVAERVALLLLFCWR